MTLYATISAELAPFFQFATPANLSQVVKTWTDSKQNTKVHLAYQNCVSCNVENPNFKELPMKYITTKTYFCDDCFEKLLKVAEKYLDDENSKSIYGEIYQGYLFG